MLKNNSYPCKVQNGTVFGLRIIPLIKIDIWLLRSLQKCYNKNNQENMQQNKQPHPKTFRLTTKKKQSIRTYSQQKAESTSSDQSAFSLQYHSLTKRLNIKVGKMRQPVLGSTVSSFGGLASFRIRTESSVSKTLHKKVESDLGHFSLSDQKIRDDGTRENFRYSTNVLNQTTKLKFTSQNFKCRKNFKIQRPSIYWQMSQQGNQIDLFKSAKKDSSQNPDKFHLDSDCSASSKQKFLQNLIYLWRIRQSLSPKVPKIKPKQVLKSIKSYILRKQSRESAESVNTSMQKILKIADQQNDLKQIVACERVIIIGIVEVIVQEKIQLICVECACVLDNLLGLYLALAKALFGSKGDGLFQDTNSELQNVRQEIEGEGVQEKYSLTSTLLYLCTKLQTIFRYNPHLLKTLKNPLSSSKKSSLNRTFYDILTLYAIHLNQSFNSDTPCQNPHISKHLTSFLTCPSPFIIEARIIKKYTLVLDLDETLVHTKMQNNNLNKYSTQYRPYAKEFISNLSQFYQIVVFTTSISTYAEEVIAPFFDFVDHVLCREHTTKAKSGYIKDLSRIGRSLQSVLIVDNLAQNFKLQPQNGILIKSWYGEKNDRELQKLEKILIKIAKTQPKDIRQELKKQMSQK